MQFATQLKNLTAHGVTEIGPALKNAFDMLNMNRNQSGIDTYGQVIGELYMSVWCCVTVIYSHKPGV